MRFSDWIKFLLTASVCVYLGFGLIISNDENPLFAFLGLAIMFGGPWYYFATTKKNMTCDHCGKKWSLKKTGQRDGEISEFHERRGDKLHLKQSWTHYDYYECSNCGGETEFVSKEEKYV